MSRHEGSATTGQRVACLACRKSGGDNSGDNLVMYDDGHGYCHACGHYQAADGSQPVGAKLSTKTKRFSALVGKVDELEHRGISKSVCRQYNYKKANHRRLGGACEVACYFSKGKLVAQHVRLKNKGFRWLGDKKKAGMFGQHLWRHGGRRIIITEGEIDCMTVYQVMQGKWPVVSISSGVNDSENAIRENIEFLSSYDEIVICFDMDEPGREAAIRCAELLPPGKVKIVSLPRKDPNAMLLKGEQKGLLTCLWEAQTHRPDGIIHAADVQDDETKNRRIYPFPWKSLTVGLMGQRSHEMTMWASGTGMGKSTVLRHIVLHHLQHNRKVGVCMLEESVSETMDDLISIKIGKPVRQIRAARELNSALAEYGEEAVDFGIIDDLSDEEYEVARHEIGSMPLFFYDHQGVRDYDGIMSKIEYMVVGLGCDVVVLDHITAVIAGSSDLKGGERRGIDELMQSLRSLVSRTGVHLDLVSQLKKPDGKPFEEGGRINAAHLRGSGSLASVPNTIIGIERNQQDPDKDRSNTVLVRALKGRFNGRTGLIGALRYDNASANLVEIEWHETAENGIHFGPREEYIDDDTTGTEPDLELDGRGSADDDDGGTGDRARSSEAASKPPHTAEDVVRSASGVRGPVAVAQRDDGTTGSDAEDRPDDPDTASGDHGTKNRTRHIEKCQWCELRHSGGPEKCSAAERLAAKRKQERKQERKQTREKGSGETRKATERLAAEVGLGLV